MVKATALIFIVAANILVALFDYWAWSSLISSVGFVMIGRIIGFTILALVSIPLTFFMMAFDIALIVS